MGNMTTHNKYAWRCVYVCVPGDVCECMCLIMYSEQEMEEQEREWRQLVRKHENEPSATAVIVYIYIYIQNIPSDAVFSRLLCDVCMDNKTGLIYKKN